MKSTKVQRVLLFIFCGTFLCETAAGAQLSYRNQDFYKLQRSLINNEQATDGCSACEAAMAALDKQILALVKSKDQMEDAVTKLCVQILKDEMKCKLVAKVAGPALWDILNLPPKEACAKIKFCSTVAFSPAPKVAFFDLTQSLVTAQSKNSSNCPSCKEVVSVLKSLLVAEESWLVEMISDHFCSLLPPGISKVCQDFVKTKLPDLIAKYVDPTKICQAIGMC